jgi:hypothetical protein
MQKSNDVREGDIASLEEELKQLKREITVIKRAVRNKIARYEIGQVKKGKDVNSILDLRDLN